MHDFFPDYDWPWISYNRAMECGKEEAEKLAQQIREDDDLARSLYFMAKKTYEEDQNPKEVWKALDLVLFRNSVRHEDGEAVTVQMPRWVFNYLRKVARFISLVSPGKKGRRKNLIYTALGFQRGKQSYIDDTITTEDLRIYLMVKDYDGPLKPNRDDSEGAFSSVARSMGKDDKERAIEDAYYRVKRNLKKIDVEIK